jgi:hypothetical protein
MMSAGRKGKPLQIGRKSEPEPERICPRCGQPYRWLERKVIDGRTYLFAVHNGYRSCYLGPVDGYVRGTITHPFLKLSAFGATPREELERRLEYLDENVRSLPKLVSTEEDRWRILEALEKARRMFEGGGAEAGGAEHSLDSGGGG